MFKCKCLRSSSNRFYADDEYFTDIVLKVEPKKEDLIAICHPINQCETITYIVQSVVIHPYGLDDYDFTLFLSDY